MSLLPNRRVADVAGVLAGCWLPGGLLRAFLAGARRQAVAVFGFVLVVLFVPHISGAATVPRWALAAVVLPVLLWLKSRGGEKPQTGIPIKGPVHMNAEELKLQDSYGRKLHIGAFAGQITITPIVEKIGDTIVLTDDQARCLKVFLEKCVSAEPVFSVQVGCE